MNNKKESYCNIKPFQNLKVGYLNPWVSVRKGNKTLGQSCMQ